MKILVNTIVAIAFIAIGCSNTNKVQSQKSFQHDVSDLVVVEEKPPVQKGKKQSLKGKAIECLGHYISTPSKSNADKFMQAYQRGMREDSCKSWYAYLKAIYLTNARDFDGAFAAVDEMEPEFISTIGGKKYTEALKFRIKAWKASLDGDKKLELENLNQGKALLKSFLDGPHEELDEEMRSVKLPIYPEMHVALPFTLLLSMTLLSDQQEYDNLRKEISHNLLYRDMSNLTMYVELRAMGEDDVLKKEFVGY